MVAGRYLNASSINNCEQKCSTFKLIPSWSDLWERVYRSAEIELICHFQKRKYLWQRIFWLNLVNLFAFQLEEYYWLSTNSFRCNKSQPQFFFFLPNYFGINSKLNRLCNNSVLNWLVMVKRCKHEIKITSLLSLLQKYKSNSPNKISHLKLTISMNITVWRAFWQNNVSREKYGKTNISPHSISCLTSASVVALWVKAYTQCFTVSINQYWKSG